MRFGEVTVAQVMDRGNGRPKIADRDDMGWGEEEIRLFPVQGMRESQMCPKARKRPRCVLHTRVRGEEPGSLPAVEIEGYLVPGFAQQGEERFDEVVGVPFSARTSRRCRAAGING
jgi:hypothetical protein